MLCRPQCPYPPLLSSFTPTCSPDYKLSITSLENGQPYRFTVRVSAGIWTAHAELPGCLVVWRRLALPTPPANCTLQPPLPATCGA